MQDVYVWAALSWLLGGLFNGIAGFGAALVAMPLILHHIPASVSVPACTMIVLALNIQVFLRYRHSTKSERVVPILLGGIPGAAVGIIALRGLSDHGLRLWLGALLIAYSFWGLFFARPRSNAVSQIWGMLAGFLSTLFGSAFGINGPPLVVYSSMSYWRKEEIKGVIGFFSVITCSIILCVQGLSGLQGIDSFILFLSSLPTVLIGGIIGSRISCIFSESTYRNILFLAVMLMGVTMIYNILLINRQ